MDDYKQRMLLSFQEEIEKTALNPAGALRSVGGFLKNQAGAAGAGMGLGAAGGGLLGGAIQGVRGYQEAKEQGAGTGQALLAGGMKGLGGAGTGAAIGAGLGGAAGLAGGGRARALASKAIEAGGPVGASARFGQRQLHSLTGYAGKDTKALKGMRAGSWDAQQRFDAAQQALHGAAGTPASQKALKKYEAAKKGLDYAREAEQMGLTSVPGYLKSLATNPAKTLKTGFGEQWHSQGNVGRALMFGLPVGFAGAEAARPSEEGGPGRGERALRGLAGGLAFTAAPIPLAGAMALSHGAETGAGLVGAGIDRHRRVNALREARQGGQQQ